MSCTYPSACSGANACPAPGTPAGNHLGPTYRADWRHSSGPLDRSDGALRVAHLRPRGPWFGGNRIGNRIDRRIARCSNSGYVVTSDLCCPDPKSNWENYATGMSNGTDWLM